MTCVTPAPAARRRKSRDRRHRPRGRHRPVSEPAQPSDDPAGTGAGYTVPARPDGWPDLLGRHPMSSADRARVRKALEDGLPAGALAAPGLASAAETADALEHVTIGSGPTPRSATVRSTTHAHSPAHIR